MDDAIPDVSVVVLAHRNATLLDRCLTGLRVHRSTAAFEVIVVANGATTDVRRVVDAHSWVVAVVSRSNRGFAGGANLGASRARGRFLAFLNDDACVTAGWLDALMHVLDTQPTTAAVGGVVTDHQGQVLEFGSSLRNLSPVSLERGRHIDELAGEVPRDVPFASACSILVRRAAFELVGGFDEAYYPAYFEDVDLCLRLWQAGHTVSVTPASMIMHTESASTSRAVRHFIHHESARVFERRWGPGLPEIEAGRPLTHDLPRRHRPVIVIDDFVPRAASGSGLGRSRRMLEALARNGDPVLFHARHRRFEPDEWLRSHGVRFVDDLTAIPDDVDPRCVVVSRPDNLGLGEVTAQRFGVPLVYDAEARFSARLETHLVIETDSERRRVVSTALDEMLDLELRAATVADHVVAISAQEANWFTEHGARAVTLVPPFPEVCDAGDAGFADRRGALFITGWLAGPDSPNADGLRWMAAEVLPHVVRRDPRFILRVTGAAPPPDLVGFASEHIEFIGEVDDLPATLERSRITVCPVRYGAGVKLKVVDSLASGVPVVATHIGAEGIDAHWGQGMIVTDDAEAFAEAIVELTMSASAWNERRTALVDRCRSHRFDLAAAWREIIDSVDTRRSVPISDPPTCATPLGSRT
jgi:O-antigen biosynthesis protein